MILYKDLKIFSENGLFTVGGDFNAEFNDCSLENLEYGPEEIELVQHCLEVGIPLRFDDLRGHEYDVPYEKYLEHLKKFEADPDGTFTDHEYIVPSVRCVSLEQAKEFIDWIHLREKENMALASKATLSSQIQSASYRAVKSQPFTDVKAKDAEFER